MTKRPRTGSAEEKLDSPDLYTPWREPVHSLKARHVGRQPELNALVKAGGRFIKGDYPLPFYLFGPRGMGKSHIFKLAYEQLKRLAGDGVTITVVPEDIPQLRDAEQLFQRIGESGKPRWMRWQGDDLRSLRRHVRPDGRTLVFFEGLDRQLDALGKQGRKQLRQILDERGDIWIAGTGVSLSGPFVNKDEAFYGAFDPWPLDGLEPDNATKLLDIMVGPLSEDAQWPARRDALVVLAGGSARALVALGQACCEHPDRWVSQQLQSVVRNFTAHYQMRFRDLSPQAQEMVELFAEAPRELAPSELAQVLGTSPSQMSVQAGRLQDDGVLKARSEGRKTWYRLAEPLFRFWLEYRTTGWEEARAGWIGNLLQAIMSPEELVDTWLKNPDEIIQRAAAAGVIQTGATRKAWDAIANKMLAAVVAGNVETWCELVQRADALPLSVLHVTLLLVMMCDAHTTPERLEAFVAPLRKYEALKTAMEVVDFFHLSLIRKIGHRDFVALVKKIAPEFGAKSSHIGREYLIFLVIIVERVLNNLRRGRPWRLSSAEKKLLSTVPVLRSDFLLRGRIATHPPLLDTGDVLNALTMPIHDVTNLFMSAVKLSDETLAATLLRLDVSFSMASAKCPEPTKVKSRELATLVARAVARQPSKERANERANAAPSLCHARVTWLGAVAAATEEPFNLLVGTLEACEPPDKDAQVQLAALSTLAFHRPDRFEQVGLILGAGWMAVLERASLLARTLNTDSGAELHPELARMRAELMAGPGAPGRA